MVATVPVNQRVNLNEDVTIGGKASAQMNNQMNKRDTSAKGSKPDKHNVKKPVNKNIPGNKRILLVNKRTKHRLRTDHCDRVWAGAGRAEGVQHQHPDVCDVQE